RIPPLRIVRRGEECADVWRLLMANTRLPVLVEGDIRALIAACAVGIRRLDELRERYGDDVVVSHVAALLDVTAQRVRADVAAMPDGEYRSEAAWLLPDGAGEVVGRLTATVHGDRITLDY